MKKGKLKKILATGAMGIMALAMPFALTGCDKDFDINVRVDGDYIQWQVEGEDSWTNLLTIDEVKGLLGESYKGDQGTPGINGKEVEFRKTETHIQWRYVDESQEEDGNWANLIALSEIKGTPGQDGSAGDEGLTPFIGTNGNWWIGETDTGVAAEGQDGYSPTIVISDDGYWVINGEKTEYKAIGQDASCKTYTITYEYQNEVEKELFYTVTLNQQIKSTEWLTGIPQPKNEFKQFFDGWYIKDTNKKITNHDFIGADVILENRWCENLFTTLNCTSFTYDSTNGGYKCEFDETQQKVIIPTLYNGDRGIKKVVSVSNSGSTSSSSERLLEEIHMPQTIKIIEEDTFSGFLKLENIKLPESVEKIESYAFGGCRTLRSVLLNDNLCSIEDYAFAGCATLNGIALPKSLTNIGVGAFKNCLSLSSITIPNKITKINNEVFKYCSNLSYVGLPYDLIQIGDESFLGCISLANIELGDLVESIGKRAFRDSGLKEVTLPYRLSEISEGMFSGCKYLEYVDMFDGYEDSYYKITSIGDTAFYGCPKLTTVNIPSTVNQIGTHAFAFCTSLTKITIPENVTYLSFTFSYCTNLKKAEIKGWVSLVATFENCVNLEKVTTSEGRIINIGDSTFENCYKLSEIEGLKSVSTIGDNAFKNCTSLVINDFPHWVHSFGSNCFENCTLKEVVLSDSLEEISDFAFARNIIEKVVIKGDKLTTILSDILTSGDIIGASDYVYVSIYMDTSNATYLLENFTKQEQSEITTCYKYKRNEIN